MNYPIIKITQNPTLVEPEDLGGAIHPLNGEKEYYFFEILQNYFGSQVKRHQKVKIDYRTYYPDFVYMPNNKVRIDIELDEPYNRGNKPIHVLEDENDNCRNNLLLESGWSIIRFSEYQVVKHPEECIKVIKEVVKSIKYKETFILRKYNYPELFIHPIWTEDDAMDMARNSIRDRHGFKLSKVLNEEPANIKMIFDDHEEFESFLIEFAESENLFKMDRRYEFLYTIADISDVLIDELTKQEYIFVMLNKSMELRNDGNFFMDSGILLGYKLEKDSHILYDKLIETKSRGKVIGFDYKYSHSDYNFFLKGKKKIEAEEKCNYIELKSQNEEGSSVFIDIYFSLPESILR